MVDSRLSRRLRLIIAVTCGLAVISAQHRLVAQTYKEVPKAITDARQIRQLRRAVSGIVRSGGALSEEDKRTLQNYYVMHVIAGMTQNQLPDDPAQFPDWRKTVVGDLSTLSDSAQKHAFVRNLIYSYSIRLVKDKEYSPAARYNALLLLGELNERETQFSGRTVTPAVPYARARQDLLDVFGSDDAAEMKVGAMLGLARHARMAAAAGGRPDADLIKLFVTVLQANEDEENPAAQMWMQRIAIDALGDIGQPGATAFIAPFLIDGSKPMMLRCAAADALGRIDYRNAANLNAQELIKGLGQLAADSLTQQIRELQQYIQDNPVDVALESRSRSIEGDELIDPESTRVRRVLKQQLTCVGRGLKALMQAPVDGQLKTTATSLLSEIGAVIKELEDETVLPHVLFDKIGQPAVRVEAAANNV